MANVVARRDFLGRVLGGVAAASIVPSAAVRAAERWRVPLSALSAPEDEAYWKMVRDQFPIRPGFTFLNAANLAPSPYAISDTVTDLTREIDREMSQVNRSKFNGLKEAARTGLAELLGADADEIAITRNTSESNNTVLNGLTLARGDEVVIWDQNHPTNNVAWDVRAERYGFTVIKVKTPAMPESAAAVTAPFLSALTQRTKVLALTHVSSSSGVGLPVKELCAAARQRGILTLVDGAQTFGSHAVHLHDLGCDFYTSSAHKWFMGPRECGVLYVRKDRAATLWPNIVGVGWDNYKTQGAKKFETLGQRDDGAVSAMGRAVEFHKAIGQERIEARVKALATQLKARLKEKVAGIQFHTPASEALSGGIVIFTKPNLDPGPAATALYEKAQITCATTGGDFRGLRFSAHIYVSMDEVNKAADAVATLV